MFGEEDRDCALTTRHSPIGSAPTRRSPSRPCPIDRSAEVILFFGDEPSAGALQVAARIGQGDAARLPVQQANVELGLELRHGRAERRLREVQMRAASVMDPRPRRRESI